MNYFFGYLALESVMSFITLGLYGLDKWYSKIGHRRIRERTLILMTLLFGAPGALIGIILIRHKSKHLQFWVAAMFGLIFQITLGILVYLMTQHII